MSQKDLAEKLLFDYNDVFADVINGYVFKGDQRIKAPRLKESKIRSQYKADDSILHEQERDVLKEWADSDIRIAMCGIENQTVPDKYMPLRIIGYDGVSYKSQLVDKNKKPVPVMTVVLYFGTDKRWNYPCNLKDVLDIPAEMDDFINDYRVNVLEVAWMDEDELKHFSSDFRIVANLLIKKRMNPDYVPDDPTVIKHYDELMKLLTIITADKAYEETIYLPTVESKEARSMCTVAQNLINKGRVEGIKEGIKEGMQNGINEGKNQSVERLTEYFMSQNPELTFDKAKEMATKILK